MAARPHGRGEDTTVTVPTLTFLLYLLVHAVVGCCLCQPVGHRIGCGIDRLAFLRYTDRRKHGALSLNKGIRRDVVEYGEGGRLC